MDDIEHPTDHRGSEVLTPEECDRLLAEAPIGRVAFVQGGETHILPVNYRFHENTIVIRTTAGSKLDAAEMHSRFAFEIDGWDVEQRRGWSVLGHGPGTVIEDEEEMAELEALGLESWAGDDRQDLWVRILLEDITGRRVG